MSKADSGHIMPDDTTKPSRRRALSALAAGSALAIAGVGHGNAASIPSSEFHHCKARYYAWFELVMSDWPTGPDWPKDTSVYNAYEERVGAALDAYYFALDDLVSLPPSRQKLSELLSLALLESKGDQRDDKERDFLSAEHALVAALETFEALGQEAA